MDRKTHAISWFEIPVSDLDRAILFYGTILDHEIPLMEFGPVRMGILPHDRSKGGIGGALVQNEQFYVPSKDGARVYLNGGEDLAMVLDKVEGAGGEVLIKKRMISPDMGYMAMFKDTEGNVVALHSTD